MAETKPCPTCQAQVELDAIFCLTCGANVEDELFDTTGDFSEDAELVEPEAAPQTIARPAAAPEDPPSGLELEERKPVEEVVPAPTIRRTSVARSDEPQIKTVETKSNAWMWKAVGSLAAAIAVIVLLRAVWPSKNAPKNIVVAEGGSGRTDRSDPTRPAPTWAGNPRGKLTPEEALSKIRDLTRGATGANAGASTLDFYRQLEDNKDGDVLDQVDTIMAASSSDGSTEWGAIECELDGGDDPEVSARCQLAALQKGKAGLEVIEELESKITRKPNSPALEGALREARATVDPSRVAALLSPTHKPVNADIYGTALQNAGHGGAAMKQIAPMAANDPRAARAAVQLLSRGGKCIESEKFVQELTRMAGAAALMEQIRYRTLCLGDPDNGAALADVSTDLPNLSKTDRGNLYAALAATALLSNNVPRAVKACEAAVSFAPSLPIVAEMDARCSLANGTSGQKAVKLTRVTPTGHVLVVARDLVMGKKLKALPLNVPAWNNGGAMVRVVFALQKNKAPIVALDEARSALLLARWDGSDDFPFSNSELLKIAAAAPPAHRPFAEAVAHLLSLRPREAKSRIGFGKTPEANAVRALVSFQLGEAPPDMGKQKLKSKVHRAVIALASKDVKQIMPLLKDREMAPKAYAELVKLKVPSVKIRRAVAKSPQHPDVLAGDLGP